MATVIAIAYSMVVAETVAKTMKRCDGGTIVAGSTVMVMVMVNSISGNDQEWRAKLNRPPFHQPGLAAVINTAINRAHRDHKGLAMADAEVTRRSAALLAADVVGYS
ncbi:MAG: hypothetical protein VCE75_19390 [Alphaproteobacteria bacterium]